VSTAIPSTFYPLFLQFAPVFTQPSFQNFVTLATGWILCAGRHTISRVIQHGMRLKGRKRHHSTLYRFLSRASWVADEVGHAMFHLVRPLLPEGPVWAIIDDTLCPRSGPHLWGTAMHHDPLRSTYGGRTPGARKVFFSYGHNWVILSLWLQLPWNPDRGLAVPVLFRLYRSKKRCPGPEYRKRTDLALELIQILASWVGPARQIIVVADSEYACKTIVRGLPANVDFIGPMAKDAAFYGLPGPQRGIGRPRVKGPRLPNPLQLAEQGPRWRSVVLPIYGRQVQAQIKTQVGLWYRVAGSRPVRMIVTRDPKGRIEDRAYFSTNLSFGVEQIAQGFSRRWTQEVMHREVKQHLGLEDPQNGYWRRPQTQKRPPKKRPGPNPHPSRGHLAVLHTAPMAFMAYALVAVWYVKHGSVRQDVERVKRAAPWYRQKREPSFADMLNAARRELWRARLSANPSLRAVSTKLDQLLPEWLMTG